MQANLITTSTSKPAKYAPRFCLKLKFNCKLRSSHPCCKFPLPPRNIQEAPTTVVPNPVKLKVRPTRIQITPASDTDGANKLRKSPFRRPLRQHPSREIIKNRNEGLGQKKESIEGSVNIEKRKIPLRSNEQRPGFNLARKTSLQTQRRRPEYSSIYKSPVCRIINCKRNKKHKCCQEPKQITTTQKTVTTTIKQSEEITVVTENEEETHQKEEDSTETALLFKNENMTSTEKMLIEATNPRPRIKETNKTLTEKMEVNYLE